MEAAEGPIGPVRFGDFQREIALHQQQVSYNELTRSSAAGQSAQAAPGAPSRWSTERSADWKPLMPKLVVEVSFDHVTNDRFRHGTKLIRFRPDKSPRQCTMDQLNQ